VKASKGWDRQLENKLPDARFNGRRDHHLVTLGRLQFERVYCVNCGCDGGLVTPEAFAHVFYLCDDCVDKHGVIAGTAEVPEATAR
jgi:hypothetical protein